MANRPNCDGYLDGIQAHGGEDILKAMLRTKVQEVMEEEMTRHMADCLKRFGSPTI